jgi:predicted amidohydrolase YtcJ
MGADLLVIGRIATLAGEDGFGWAEAIAIAGGRVVAAGSVADAEALAGPRTRRLALAPDEVAIPGLTDAHLHLADAAMAESQVDLEGARTLDEGLPRIADAHDRMADPEAWLEGHGWDADRWGGWPTASDLERVAPGRRAAFWAHDHHSYWVSVAALAAGGVTAATADPPGGVIRRLPDGGPSGVLHEAAARLVSLIVPLPTTDELVGAIPLLARRLLALGVVSVHDPGTLIPDPDLARAHPAYRRLSDAGELPVRVHACLRPESLATALARGLRSGAPLGEDTAGRAVIGWQKLFADGTLGARTARLLAPVELPPGEEPPPGGMRGVWMTDPAELSAYATRAAEAGIATQIHAIGDEAVRVSLEILAPTARRTPFAPRLEHVQLLDPADRGRFATDGIAASVQPIHLRSDADKARVLWGERAEAFGYPWATIAASGALMPFGTDAPVEPIDPWPGIAMAVTRLDPDWRTGARPFGPTERLSLPRALRSASLDAPRSAGEEDRGRLTVGHRADLVVIPAAAVDSVVEPGGPLATCRPRLVLMDGEVVFEA